ncbi:hypothetical protein [Streptomyces sp. NPDC085540]|uniref:hypothetical protein n=1 Tax=Streptomyces sp. NPDC085540 TaxID=3365730 RepID=UPI0037CF7214
MVAGRRIRFTAVLVGVVFALTGFSSHGGSSSGSSGKSKSSSGGGCSSSKSKKKGHGSSNRSTATASPSASATGAPATAVVVNCVGGTLPVTTVRFTSNADRRATYAVNLYRQGPNGATIESTEVEVTLEARETRTVEVVLKEPSRAAEVTTCRLDRPRESADGSASGPAGTTSGGSGSTPGAKSTPKKPGPKSTRKP